MGALKDHLNADAWGKYQGWRVTTVRTASAVELLGLKEGDVILRTDNHGKAFSDRDLYQYIRKTGVIPPKIAQTSGQLTLARDGKVIELNYFINP